MNTAIKAIQIICRDDNTAIRDIYEMDIAPNMTEKEAIDAIFRHYIPADYAAYEQHLVPASNIDFRNI